MYIERVRKFLSELDQSEKDLLIRRIMMSGGLPEDLEVFLLAETVIESKMKGRKTISRRRYDDYDEGKIERYTLDELFQKFIKTTELEGLQERTIADHKLIYRYFKEFLTLYDTNTLYGEEVTTETIRDYIYYMKNENQLWENHPWLEKKLFTQKRIIACDD